MTTTAESLIADLDGELSARVDRAAAVRLVGHDWIIDWMIATEAGWQTAADAGAVRQHLVEHAPVVETTVRVDGGQLVHRAFVAADRDGTPAVVIEARNDSPHAVGLAFVLRSAVVDAAMPPVEWAGRGGGETEVDIGGEVTAVLPDPAAVVSAEDDASLLEAMSGPTESSTSGALGGSARVALVRPLPHTLTTRIAVSPVAGGVSPIGVADAEAVARGWTRHTRGGGRVELPEPVLSDLVSASRAQVLMAVRLPRPDTGVGAAVVDARLADALRAMGQDRLAAGLGARRLAQLDRKGLVDDGSPSPVAATGATLQILGGAAGGLDVDEVQEWLPEVSGMLVALDKAAGRSPGHDGGWDGWWADAGRRGAVRLLEVVGQGEAAARVRARLSGSDADGPAGLVASLDGRPADVPSWRRILEARAAVRQGCWPDEQLRWLVAATEATGVMPLAADDHLVAAEVVALWRDLGAVEGRDGVIMMLPAVRSRWLGHPLEAHEIAVGTGTVGFAIRWHGARPALLWESKGVEGATLTCPGLDPDWSTREARGDALLAAPVANDEVGGSIT